jgi:hypothetical protein
MTPSGTSTWVALTNASAAVPGETGAEGLPLHFETEDLRYNGNKSTWRCAIISLPQLNVTDVTRLPIPEIYLLRGHGNLQVNSRETDRKPVTCLGKRRLRTVGSKCGFIPMQRVDLNSYRFRVPSRPSAGDAARDRSPDRGSVARKRRSDRCDVHDAEPGTINFPLSQ